MSHTRTDALAAMTAERDRLQRACDEGLPREYLECPACHAQHIEGPRHDNPALDGRTRPHHTHRCYGCGHVWDAGRWSFGADVPKPLPDNAAFADARREGAAEMLARCRAVVREAFDAHPLTLDRYHQPGCICDAIGRGSCSECDRDEAIMAALAALTTDAPGGESCTGLSARWCPRCGDCKCPPLHEGGERTLDDPRCPLHAPSSPHGDAR